MLRVEKCAQGMNDNLVDTKIIRVEVKKNRTKITAQGMANLLQ